MTYKPPETTKAEMIQAVSETMQIGRLIRSPNLGWVTSFEWVTRLNEQLGKLKNLADYLPESKGSGDSQDWTEENELAETEGLYRR